MPAILIISSYADSLNAVRPEGRLFVGLARDHGWEVTLMTQDGSPYTDVMKAAGVRIIDWHPTGKFQAASVRKIREELKRGKYDILHLYNNKAIVNGIRAARGLPVKVATYRGYTGNINWWDPISYLQHLSPRVDLITCVSPAVKEVFDRVPFFNTNKAVVVGKGHEPAWYQKVEALDLKKEFAIPTDRVTIAVVANARRMKGMNYLTAAMRKLPTGLPLHFLFIGRGLDTKANLNDIGKSAYSDRVTFAGFRKDVLRLIKAADVSLLPSVKGEGLSKVLLESMFLARPTIMTSIGGNRHLGVDGETALIVPPRDAAALADAIERVAKDEPLRQRIGPAGETYVTRYFSAEVSAAELNDAYHSLLNA
ncbi:glycosyl transferase family 1 [Lewinellaceae bacterium SD302]|nr:glycosyl transferase family 1 [Lewinellaceae bacterium SD302]